MSCQLRLDNNITSNSLIKKKKKRELIWGTSQIQEHPVLILTITNHITIL